VLRGIDAPMSILPKTAHQTDLIVKGHIGALHGLDH
jgi:hypothetical protein